MSGWPLARAITNVAVGGWYPDGQMRLGESLDAMEEEADRLFWLTFPGKSHSESNYGFKVDVFDHALEEGYDLVFWIDSSCVLKNPLPWDELERDGYWLAKEGWTVGQWINDEALDIMNLTRETANNMTLIEGKVIGLNLKHPLGKDFLREWRHYRDEGAFNGSWKNHRHDISVGGVIAHRMSLKLHEGAVKIAPPHVKTDCLVIAQGM